MNKLLSALANRRGLEEGFRLICLSIVSLLTASASVLNAQVSSYNDQTVRPIDGVGHDYIKLLAETVNPSNGSLNIGITPPLAPSRGFTIPLTIGYGSGGAYAVTADPDKPRSVPGGGWSLDLPSISDDVYSTQAYVGAGNGTSCQYATDFLMTDAGGVQHDLNLALASYASTPGESGSQNESCGSASMQDGDTMVQATLTGTQSTGSVNVTSVDVSDSQGLHYHFSALQGGGPPTSTPPDYIEDRNGNKAVFQTANGIGYTDTNGRTAVSLPAGIPSSGSSTVTVSGLSYVLTWRQATASYSVPYQKSYEDSAPYACANLAGVDSSESVLSSITLPNQQSYQFFYGDNPTDPSLANPYGLISEIIYPNGGWVKYTWKFSDTVNELLSFAASNSEGPSDPGGCRFEYQSPVIATRQVGTGSTTLQTQSFVYNTVFDSQADGWNSKTTTVTTTDNVAGKTTKTIYLYSPLSVGNDPYDNATVASQLPLESTVQYFDWGPSTSPIRVKSETWFDQFFVKKDSLTEGTGQNAQTKTTTYCYNNSSGCAPAIGSINAPTTITETDWGQTSSARTTTNSYNLGSFTTPCKQVITGSDGSQSETDRYFDNEPTLCGTYSRSTTQAVSNLPAGTHDETAYGPDSAQVRGNVTSTVEVLSSGSTNTTTSTYDETGQMVSTTDANGYTTTYSYADSPAQSENTNSYLTTLTRPSTSSGSQSVAHVNTSSYDYTSGNLISSTDENRLTTTYAFADPARRVTSVSYPDGGQTSFSYNDNAGTVTTSVLQAPGKSEVETDTYDGLGRLVTKQVTGDDTLTSSTSYDGMGNVSSQTNPTRPGGSTVGGANQPPPSSTDGSVSFAYDALARLITKTLQDGSVLQYCYNNSSASAAAGICSSRAGSLASGTWTNYVDANGQRYQQVSDGLGRLTSVFEPDTTTGSPALETDYSYDNLDEVTRIDQWGGLNGAPGDRVRMFVYDGAGHTLASLIPEQSSAHYPASLSCKGVPSSNQWTSCYTYDANGNLLSKTSNAGIVSRYDYDALNRPTGVSYANDPAGTPAASFNYDLPNPNWQFPSQTFPSISGVVQANLTGRLSYISNANATIVYSYDQMGRTTLRSECTPLTCPGDHFDTHTAYDLAGNKLYADDGFDAVRNAQSPNSGYYYGRLTFSVDLEGRLTGATSDIVDNTHPASVLSNIGYSPLGGISMVQIGSNYSQASSYVPRGWLKTRYAIDSAANLILSDTWTHDSNGNISQIQDSEFGQLQYAYDNLNRLTAGPNGYGSTSYGYDNWGNLISHTATGGYSVQTSTTADTHNQLGYFQGSYDADGRLLADNVNTYTFDAENHVLTVSGQTRYLYGPDGLRVAKSSGGAVSTEYVYDTDGNLAATVGTDGRLVRSILRADGVHYGDYTTGSGSGGGSTEFRLGDSIGTLVYNMDQSGNLIEECAAGPFGEAENCTSQLDYTETHFADSLEDQESGLNYMGARSYSPTLSRFLSPDPSSLASASATDPQSLNLYSYVTNNPLIYIDPTGLRLRFTNCVKAAPDSTVYTENKAGTSNTEATTSLTVTGSVTSCDVGDDGGGTTRQLSSSRGHRSFPAPSRLTSRLQCAAANAQSLAGHLGISSNNFVGQSLLGNDFSSLTSAVLGPDAFTNRLSLGFSNGFSIGGVPLNLTGLGIAVGTAGQTPSPTLVGLVERGGAFHGTDFMVPASTVGATKVATKLLGAFSLFKLGYDALAFTDAYLGCHP